MEIKKDGWTLFFEGSNTIALVDEKVLDSHGLSFFLQGGTPPKGNNNTRSSQIGVVYVGTGVDAWLRDSSYEYYPTVFRLEWRREQ